jgi:hypothetical protein
MEVSDDPSTADSKDANDCRKYRMYPKGEWSFVDQDSADAP